MPCSSLGKNAPVRCHQYAENRAPRWHTWWWYRVSVQNNRNSASPLSGLSTRHNAHGSHEGIQVSPGVHRTSEPCRRGAHRYGTVRNTHIRRRGHADRGLDPLWRHIAFMSPTCMPVMQDQAAYTPIHQRNGWTCCVSTRSWVYRLEPTLDILLSSRALIIVASEVSDVTAANILQGFPALAEREAEIHIIILLQLRHVALLLA